MPRIKSHLNYANVMATIAVFVALGGSSYAAVSLARNSVKSKHIAAGQVKRSDLAKDAVTSTRVRDGSLLVQDFKAGSLPPGPKGATGPQGPAGTPGANGTVAAFHVEGALTNLFLTGNSSKTAPAQCQTGGDYEAGEAEAAIVTVNVNGSATAAIDDDLQAWAMSKQDAGSFTATHPAARSVDALDAGAANATVTDMVPLTAGSAYNFSAGIASGDPLTFNGSCFITVTIIKNAAD